MTTFTQLSLLTLCIFSVISCGSAGLDASDLAKVERGEKALLVTKNSTALSPLELLSYNLLGTRDSTKILKVDHQEIHFPAFALNHSTLVEPGTRRVRLRCERSFKDADKSDTYDDITLVQEFIGGRTYYVQSANSGSAMCVGKIVPVFQTQNQ